MKFLIDGFLQSCCRTISSLFFLAGLISLPGCQVVKDSKDMKKTLTELNRKADPLSKRIIDVEEEATFEASARSFDNYVEKLFAENDKTGQLADRSVVTDADAAVFAGMAIKSMYFQFWKGDYNDTKAALDDRYELALELFFARANKHIPRHLSVNEVEPSRSWKGLAALGALSDELRPEYVVALNKNSLPVLGLYQVLVQGLKNDLRVGPHQDYGLKKMMAKVSHWRQESIYVLQLRHNFFPLMVLTRMSDLHQRGKMGQLKFATLGFQVDLNPPDKTRQISEAQLIEWTRWLNKSLETVRVLRELGIEPQFNQSVATLFQALDFGQAKILRQPVESLSSTRSKLEFEFASSGSCL
jgi:hypothetical protein